MADLYWNAPSSPGFYSDGNNWRVGSSSGPVHGSTPTTTDNVFFVSSSSTVSCIFDVNPDINSFTANDPNSGFQLGMASLGITFRNTFELSNASPAQASMFSILGSAPSYPAVTIIATGSATKYVNIGPWQIGGLAIQNSLTTTTTYLQSAQGATIFPFKCYSLVVYSGIAEFDVANCDGAHLGLPNPTGSSGYGAPAIQLPNVGGGMYKRLKMQFPASKKIILYNDFIASMSSLSNIYDLYWEYTTIIEVRGYQGIVRLDIDPLPTTPGVGISPMYLPFVYNYLGEDASGAPVTSGGTLQFGGNGASYPSNWKPLKLNGLTCTAVGSGGTGTYARGIQMGTGYNYYSPTPFLYDLLITDETPYGYTTLIFNVAGSLTQQVTLTSNTPGVPSRFKVTKITPPIVTNIYYTNLSNISADNTTGSEYLAYTLNGNVDAGLNSGWTFAPAASGFLGFFL